MGEFTHFSADGATRMVDVGDKPVTRRTARAAGAVLMQAATLRSLQERNFSKGDVLEVARLAGIMASKKTANLIPLCHLIPLEKVELHFDFQGDQIVEVEAEVSTEAKTGVEMEALTAVSVACLTIYDMCKSVDRSIEISNIRLMRKSGGRSGDFIRSEHRQTGE